MDRTTADLITLCSLFAGCTGRRVATVSRLCTGSGATVGRLRAGHSITTRRVGRALQYLSDHWPADAEWPVGIERPPPATCEQRGRKADGAASPVEDGEGDFGAAPPSAGMAEVSTATALDRQADRQTVSSRR